MSIYEAAIASLPCARADPAVPHRSHTCFSLVEGAGAIEADSLSLPPVKAAAALVARWAESSSMPDGFWREVTIRMSARDGALHVKLILQAPTSVAAASSVRDAKGEAALLAAAAALNDEPCWARERPEFESHLRGALGPACCGACFQLALGRARPTKGSRCFRLWGDMRLRERHAGCEYLVGPETFSQVNPATAAQLVALVQGWLGLPGGVPAAPVASAAAARAVREARAVLVSGAQPSRLSSASGPLHPALLHAAGDRPRHQPLWASHAAINTDTMAAARAHAYNGIILNPPCPPAGMCNY